MQPPYRDTLEVVRAELAALRSRRAAEVETAGQLVPILARRWSHGICGLGLILGAVTLTGAALTTSRPGSVTAILIGTLAFAAALRVVSRPLLTAALRRRLRVQTARDIAGPRPGLADADPQSALEALRAAPDRGTALVLTVTGYESSGLVVPLIGLCLTLPLSIHLAIWAVLQMIGALGSSINRSFWSELGTFDEWIRFSLILVGLAHLALVIGVCNFVARLRAPGFRPPSPFMPLMAAVAASAFPCALLAFHSAVALLPIFIAFATGILFVPFLLTRASLLFRDERNRIKVVEDGLAKLSGCRSLAS